MLYNFPSTTHLSTRTILLEYDFVLVFIGLRQKKLLKSCLYVLWRLIFVSAMLLN